MPNLPNNPTHPTPSNDRNALQTPPNQPSNPYRLVLLCTQTDRVLLGNCVIEFPAHADIRCNGSPLQADLWGIKNCLGTVNPADLTAQIIMMQDVQNTIDVTFSEPKSEYTVMVYVVEKNTVSQMMEKIRKRGFISKVSTLIKSIPLVCLRAVINCSEGCSVGCGYYTWARDVNVEGSDFDEEGYIAL